MKNSQQTIQEARQAYQDLQKGEIATKEALSKIAAIEELGQDLSALDPSGVKNDEQMMQIVMYHARINLVREACENFNAIKKKLSETPEKYVKTIAALLDKAGPFFKNLDPEQTKTEGYLWGEFLKIPDAPSSDAIQSAFISIGTHSTQVYLNEFFYGVQDRVTNAFKKVAPGLVDVQTNAQALARFALSIKPPKQKPSRSPERVTLGSAKQQSPTNG